MRNRRITAVGLVLVLSLASMSFKCGGGGCADNSPLCTSARAADTIAKSISEMITVKRELAKQGKLTRDEDLKLTQMLLRLNTADKVFVKRLDSLNAAPDAPTKQQLLSLFNNVTAALDDLNTNGVLGVQDADARNRLATIITAIRASVDIILPFLKS
ncbi:MAG: hypothetical protein JOZ02_08005 [Acidobacteria bacterium]|nr:hypothetical protein [Acidobacteriota bacterium]